MNVAYNFVLVSIIAISTWAIFTRKIKDKLWLCGGLVLIIFGASAILTQSITSHPYDEQAIQVMVTGMTIIGWRCFYIKSLKRKIRKYMNDK